MNTARMRRRETAAAMAAAALALTWRTASGFFLSPSRVISPMQIHSPNALRTGRLHMSVGGPRGRSRPGGLSIEGADGASAVLTSSTASPIQSLQESMDEYADDELVGGAPSVGADLGLDDFRGFTGAKEVMQDRRKATLSRKNTFIVNAIVTAALGAGLWVTVTSFLKRQSALVDAYADEMTYHVGDEREMQACHKEYKGKLGPGLYRGDMFKEVMLAIGAKKPITLETLRSVKYIIKLFKLKTVKAMKLLVVAARNTERSQTNVRSKLYFLGTLIAKGNEKAIKILEPLRKNIESSFPGSDGAEMLKVRLDNMAEGALKSAIEAVPDDEVLESGWEELGISDERAAEIAGAIMDEDDDLMGIDFYKTGGPGTNDEESDPEAAQMLKQLEAGIEEKKTEPQDEKDPEPEGAAKSYECQVCGYKMFVAKGREFKFFGDNFKCPECGAGKDKFIEGDMDVD